MRRKFPISVILTVTSGVILPGVELVPYMISFMLGYEVSSDQREQAVFICREHLLNQLPQLRGVIPLRNQSPDYYLTWIAEQEKRYGGMLEVERISQNLLQ